MKSISKFLRISTTSEIPDIGVKMIDTVVNSTGLNKLSIEASSKAKYLCIYPLSGSESIAMGEVINTLIVVKGSEVTDHDSMLIFKEKNQKTTNVSDGNKYRFLCKNLSIIEDGDTTERLEGKIYLVTK